MEYPIKQYLPQDYVGEYNLLMAEKELMLKALIRTGGNIKEAHKLLSPEDKPYYSYKILQIRLKQHGIKMREIKKDSKQVCEPVERKSGLSVARVRKARLRSVETEEVQRKLRVLAKKSGIVLRSLSDDKQK